MDYATCNVVYVDRSAGADRLYKRGDELLKTLIEEDDVEEEHLRMEGRAMLQGDRRLLRLNVATLLETFSEVYVCRTGAACISKITELTCSSTADLIPILVLIDIPTDDELEDLSIPRIEDRSPSPTSRRDSSTTDIEDLHLYGGRLLEYIISDIKKESISRLVVPVIVMKMTKDIPKDEDKVAATARVKRPESQAGTPFSSTPIGGASINIPPEQQRAVRYVDIGAVDILRNPIHAGQLPNLAIQIYRIYKEYLHGKEAHEGRARDRHRSWVGLGESKPYAYLREAMVSNLMDGICDRNDAYPSADVAVHILSERRQRLVRSIASWDFSAHDFTDDELLHGASLMLQHALELPALEEWRISNENLKRFLVACRSAYNSFLPYHNFRHVIDVLQAVFYFLVHLGTLPPYPHGEALPSELEPRSPIAALLSPFDALTLLITAIGHDVGHPGVNNAFLVTLNAPIAQLYNGRSVLESFHCAAYSQILRRYWPAAFSGVEMRQLMISSILATDMGLHFDYMKRLSSLQEQVHEDVRMEGWNGRAIQECRTLLCSLLTKCADISNVVRPFDCAARWTMILTDEFSRQSTIEADLGIPTALFAPPVREVIEVGQSQIGFINIFAHPLFQAVADIMPAMGFCLEELERNKRSWEEKISAEQARMTEKKRRGRRDSDDSMAKEERFSPRRLSMALAGATMLGENAEDEGNGGGAAAEERNSTTTRPPLPSAEPNASEPDQHIEQSRPATAAPQRTSDTTVGSASASSGVQTSSPTEWASQVTEGETGKAGSVGSCEGAPRGTTARQGAVRASSSPDLRRKGGVVRVDDEEEGEAKGARESIVRTMRGLARKPSKGRFRFWKRRGEVVPPVPVEG